MSGFLNATLPRTATIKLAGEQLVMERARLGLNLLLAREADIADDALRRADVSATAQSVRAYLSLAGLGDHIEKATGTEMLYAYLTLTLFNAPLFLLPFMKSKPDKSMPLPAYDYQDRGFAVWIHKLATRYGWTRHYIMDKLFPEEAMCYLQEIVVSEYYEGEGRRMLSEMAYKYDKGAKVSRYRPLPMPSWMSGRKDEPKKVRIHLRFLPMGDVVDLSKMQRPEDVRR